MSSPAKFPRLHIADSVVNRLLNLNDSLRADREMSVALSMPDIQPPEVADPTLEGGAINMALSKPVEPSNVGGGMEGLAGTVAKGDDLLGAF